jgi:hypothetical protein
MGADHDVERPPVAASPAPVTAAVPAAAGPMPSGAGGLTPATVLALQRSAGNAAVSAVLARQPTPAPAAPPAAGGGPKEGPLAAGEIQVQGGGPKPKGSWAMESKVDGDRLVLGSPLVEFDATLSVAAPATERKIPSTTVGFIQTVKTADRQGIYTTDGTPSGQPVATKHTSAAGTRDVQTNLVADAGGVQLDDSGKPVQFQKALPPWYDNPGYLDDQQRSTTVSTADKTKAVFPLETEYLGKKGKLAKTAGADRFRMAVAAKPGDAAATFLKSEDWDSPWDSTIDPATHAASKTGAVWIHPSDVPLSDQKEPTGAVNKDKIDWTAVRTVADAKALGAAQCLSLLPLARQYDPESYEVMATALRELNPVLGADVGVMEGKVAQFTLAAEGARGVQTRTANTPGVAVWRLLDFFDPNDIAPGTTIKLHVTGPDSSGDLAWAFPFGGGSVTVDGVRVSVRVGGSTMAPTAPVSGAGPAFAGAPPPLPPR